MSYDIQVWSVRSFQPEGLRKPEIWQKESAAWVHSRKNWQIVVSASDTVQPEDVPQEISKLLPGIEWLTNLNLEGKASGEAFKLVQSAADDIARYSHGAVLDQQDGSIRLPSGVKRFLSPRAREAFDVLSMSWWFLDSPIESRDGREQFVAFLERSLPECLPKRYGLYEPPQNVYADTGREHFLQFWDENLHDMIVWYPQRPVVSVHFGLPNPKGAAQAGVSCKSFEYRHRGECPPSTGLGCGIEAILERHLHSPSTCLRRCTRLARLQVDGRDSLRRRRASGEVMVVGGDS